MKTPVPHIEDEPLQFAIRKGTSQLWVKKKGAPKSVREYLYVTAAPDIAEKNGVLISDPKSQGYELVDINWKVFSEKMPLAFYCGIIENHTQQITYLFEHLEFGTVYEMHWTHFEKFIRSATVVTGVFFEEWTMVRRRNRYTIIPVWMLNQL